MAFTQDDIINAARSQVGIAKFRHQGRVANQFLDCVGLAIYVAKQIGVEYNDVEAYGTSPSNGLLESALDNQPCLTRVFDKQKGDLLLMRFKLEPQHVAFYTGENIIHTYQAVNQVCEHRLDEQWNKRIVRIYRFNGVVA